MYESSKTARDEVSKMRAILGRPEPASEAWERLRDAEKGVILRAAGLAQSWAGEPWELMPGAVQGLVREAAQRAANWARGLEL